MPFTTKEQEIIKYGQQSGKTPDQIMEAISNLRLGIVPEKKIVQPVAQTEPSLLQRIGTDYATRADRLSEIWARPTDTRTKLQQSLGQGAGGAANIIEQTAMSVPGVKQAVGAIGAGMEWLTNTPVVQSLGNVIGSNKAVQQAVELYDTDPNFKDTVDGVANLVRLGMDVQGIVDSAAFTKNVTSKLVQKAKTFEMPGGGSGGGPGGGLGADVTQKIEGVKTALSRQNVPETFETSVQRLSEPKMSIQGEEFKSPLDKYNEYLAQEEKFKKDIKADTALSKVGEDIGNQYEKVIAQRRAAGKTMAEEVKKIGRESTDISNSFAPLEQELKDNGLIFSKGKLKVSGATKMGTQDIGSLEFYVNELNKLGANPTVQQLDAFLSRVPSELDVYKAKNNITKTTNAERIIKGNLAEIRKQLTENPNPAFKAYAEARKTYADLTNFLDEGASFLGKKTQAGDYAKDASVAKSAVQSILNQGKKDWLLRLEDLTGYPAVDNSMIALQAMKDAGNFRGLSLLETLSSGGLPTTKAGAIDKAIGFGLEKGRSMFMGTSAEQTRRIIQENMRQKGLGGLDLQEIGTKSNKSKSNSISDTIPQNNIFSKIIDTANTDVTKIEPKAGLSIAKVFDPVKIADKMDNLDYSVLKKSVDNPSDTDAWIKADNLLDKMKANKLMTDAEREVMKTEIVRAYEERQILKGLKNMSPEELAMKLQDGSLSKDDFLGKTSPAVGQTADLVEQAKKFDTPEEFVRAQGTQVYHGSDSSSIIEREGFKIMPNTVNAYGDGIYFTTSISDAKGWGGLVKAMIPNKLKLYNAKASEPYTVNTKKLVSEGYDGVEVNYGNKKHIIIFDPSQIKTRAQLSAIWKQAHNK